MNLINSINTKILTEEKKMPEAKIIRFLRVQQRNQSFYSSLPTGVDSFFVSACTQTHALFNYLAT